MPTSRDRVGSMFGMLTFVCGIALLLLTFIWAYRLFSQSPEDALGIVKGQTIDLNVAGRSAIGLVYRIALLLLMCIMASVIANRGIKLYSAAKTIAASPPEEVPST